MRKNKADDIRNLLADLCEQLGLSIATRHPEIFESLVEQGAKAFAEAVLVEEGLNPRESNELAQRVNTFVLQRFERWACEN
jgi:hypothetical protein